MIDPSISRLLLEWNDELLHSLSQSTSSCIAIFTIDGELLFSNEAMNSLFVGDPSKSLINPSFPTLVELPEQGVGSIFDGYITIGDRFNVNSSIVAQVYRKNNMLLFVGGVNAKNLLEQNQAMHMLNRKINDLQRELIKEKHGLEIALDKLNEVNSELNLINATKDKFFSIIAHDLRNPFGSVLALSSMLAQKVNIYPIDRIEVFANNLFLASKQAYNLLENLLEWSRVQTGRLKPSKQAFPIDETIASSLELCKNMAQEKFIDIVSEKHEEINVFADKEMVSAIVRNLLTNAIKFTKPNGKVSISTYMDGNNLIISVADTGVGIAQQDLDNLFKIDKMISDYGTNNEKGTGLGLILCKEFVEMNNGEIWAESTLDLGTTFFFSLPLHKADA